MGLFFFDRCEADPYATKLRVGGRLFDSKADEKAVRESLGEEDATFQQVRADEGYRALLFVQGS